MKYSMNVFIENPTKDKEETLSLICCFTRDETGYGKKLGFQYMATMSLNSILI